MITRASIAAIQLPPLVAALVVAEFFFKFHSFTLEAVPFLVLWYALRRVYAPVERWARERVTAHSNAVA
jgi:hypothetical protein